MDKIVVAIHGVGPVLRSDAIRATVHRFGTRGAPPLPKFPLGHFNIGGFAEVCVSRLDVPVNDPLARIGFAEIYWADVLRGLVKRNDTMEESKAWGETVVGRAQFLYKQVQQQADSEDRKAQLEPRDFSMAAGVCDELIESVAVMEALLFLPTKAGLLKFDLPDLLRDYYGSVQLVADFQYYRQIILFRFHSAMREIIRRFHRENPSYAGDPEIYIVAHSEGSVIAFIAILEALSHRRLSAPGQHHRTIPTDWIVCVRGFMTIGSPIDKHILLWPDLWEPMELASRDCQRQDVNAPVEMIGRPGDEALTLPSPIKWRNYYDYGDPVGFELNTARKYLREHACGAFQFSGDDDFGFSRYWLPGKAHVDYWKDDAVFDHFIDHVVLPGKRSRSAPQARSKPQAPSAGKVPPPPNKPGVGFISTAIPYVICYLLQAFAVFLLFKTVLASLPGLRDYPPVTRSVLLLALLLMGVTVAGRLPRLIKTRGLRWRALALAVYLCGAVPCVFFLPSSVSGFLDEPLAEAFAFTGTLRHFAGSLTLVLIAGAVSLTGWFAPLKPRWGRWLLVGSGTLLLAVAIIWRVISAPDTAAIWPLVLAAFFFIYLWLLAVMMFDLAFIWHRYIRHSVALEVMRDWRARRDAAPREKRQDPVHQATGKR
jgi:hypothetical protein